MLFRGFFRKRRLRKDASQVQTRFFPIGYVRTAAVIIDGAAVRVDECVEQIEKFCRTHGIGLRLMYVDMRKFNSKFRLPTDISRTLTRRDLNWFGKPSLRKVAQITSDPVDLYLCLYNSDLYCVKYISSTVRAMFKVGIRDYEGDPFNFVVSPPPDQSAETKEPAPVDVEAVFLKIRDLLGKVR